MNEKKWQRISLEEISSTNEYAKEKRRKGNNLIVTAKRQSGGRGTKGRSFSSNEGGVYLSRLTFYEDFKVAEAFKIMSSAAVAVCKTLSAYGLKPRIKWPNDIFVGGKKICGILIENTFCGGNISSSVVGIGLNVCNTLPDELREIATTMQKESGVKYAVDEVTATLIEALEVEYSIEDYREYLGYLGEEVTLLIGDERISAILLSVDDEGRLRVQIGEEERALSSAEVSVRV